MNLISLCHFVMWSAGEPAETSWAGPRGRWGAAPPHQHPQRLRPGQGLCHAGSSATFGSSLQGSSANEELWNQGLWWSLIPSEGLSTGRKVSWGAAELEKTNLLGICVVFRGVSWNGGYFWTSPVDEGTDTASVSPTHHLVSLGTFWWRVKLHSSPFSARTQWELFLLSSHPFSQTCRNF